jgi:regulatory protein
VQQHKNSPVTVLQALEKARKFCAYQERYSGQVRSRLFEWGIRGEEADQVIAQLITEGFINEARFAQAFCSGKFRIKKWGRFKIVSELKKKNISAPCIRIGLTAIDEEEYINTLQAVAAKKNKEIKDTDKRKRRAKLYSYLVAKGYEPELIRVLFEEADG